MLTSLKRFKEHRIPIVMHNIQCSMHIPCSTERLYCAPHICQLCLYVLYCTCIFSSVFVCAFSFHSIFFHFYSLHLFFVFFVFFSLVFVFLLSFMVFVVRAVLSVTAAVNIRVGQNHRKSFRFASHSIGIHRA